MSPLAELKNLGVDVRLDGADGLCLGGLRSLAPAVRHQALELARQRKGQIVAELEQRAAPARQKEEAEVVMDGFDDFRGERHFPSSFNDWGYRLMVDEGRLLQ
ncbi:MAG: hypothetical protein LBR82_01035 [Desulfovibrio sp.]|jgi:hypothetical protein|nr:hypothetical protein [Desulfovibrio sp.]